MDPREDDDRPYDDSDENDPLIRELRLELVRLQAQLDQLTAAVAERAEEAEAVRQRMAELEALMVHLRTRMQQRSRLVFWTGLMWGTAIGMWVSWLLRLW